jgi:hypothetical protein
MPKKPKEKCPKIAVFPQSFALGADRKFNAELAVEN